MTDGSILQSDSFLYKPGANCAGLNVLPGKQNNTGCSFKKSEELIIVFYIIGCSESKMRNHS